MGNTFTLKCNICGATMQIGHKEDTDINNNQDLTVTVMNSENDLILIVCTKCGNEIEVEV